MSRFGGADADSVRCKGLPGSHPAVVVLIDRDPERVEDLTYSLDVLAMEGDGTSLDTLEEAGLEQADPVIASTDVDESNLAICGTATTVADPFTIARVRNVDLFRTWERSQGAFSVDFMVCSTSLTAAEAAQVVELPQSLDADRFAHGVRRTETRRLRPIGTVLGYRDIRELVSRMATADSPGRHTASTHRAVSAGLP